MCAICKLYIVLTALLVQQSKSLFFKLYTLAALTRYWFEFQRTKNVIAHGVQIGCGVTAFDYPDALQLLQVKMLKDDGIPEILNCLENVDIRTLDQGHVIPNVWPPTERRIWYPLFYHDNT